MTHKKLRSRYFREGKQLGFPYYIAQQYAKYKMGNSAYDFRNVLIDNGAICIGVEKAFKSSDNRYYWKEMYRFRDIIFVYSEYGMLIL